MSSKRALVVDDSKSARAFLARILERHEIHVDAAESAEAALEYLTRNKPDVIFMDHLMPGMDGFQAVQTIKNNPRTSSIPILMYTSQEGDLYLGQARALGAEGVLPKQIKQTDVTRMLFQLRLVSDRRERDRDQTTFTAMANVPDLLPANESAIIVETPAVVPPVVQPPAAPSAEAAPPAAATPEPAKPDPITELLPSMSLEIRAAFDASLQKEIAALRSFIGGQLETHSERLQGDIAALMPGPRTPEVHAAPIIPERRASTWVGWTLAVLALAGAGALGWLWWNRGAEVAALKTDLAAAYEELETLRARPAVLPAPAEVAPADARAADAAVDPDAVMPEPDAPDAAAAAAPGVDLVPAGGTVTPPAQASVAVAPVATQSAPVATTPAADETEASVDAASQAPSAADGTPAAVPPSQAQ